MSGQFKQPDQPVIVEPVPVTDIFAEGIARIERVGRSLIRFHLYVTETSPNGTVMHVIVAKIIRPADNLLPSIRQTLVFADEAQMIDANDVATVVASHPPHN